MPKKEGVSIMVACTRGRLTHCEDFDEILHATILGVDTGNNTFEIPEPFDNSLEFLLERGMINQVLNGVKSIWVNS